MANDPTIAEIKAAEDKAAAAVQGAKEAAARKLDKAQTDAEDTLKEIRQTAARQFREKIQRAEEAAEIKAKDILAKRESEAKAFYGQHQGKVAGAASWITEEVMGRYGRG
ncbi:MAG: cell envelope biogenesis protein TolA [Synergistaceae bacterium]|nr:cell envelope biogenesis protein TolA [Synergistaceae bacterium]